MNNQEQRRNKGTWSNEGRGPDFRGASESVIEGHRPNLALDPGRRSNWGWVMLVFFLLVAASGAAIWFWFDDISAWMQASPSESPSGDTESGTGESGDAEPQDAGPGASGEAESTTGAPAATGAAASTASTGAADSGPAAAWPSPADPPTEDPPSAATGASGGAATGAGESAATPPTTGTAGGAATISASFSAFSTSAISKSRSEKLLAELPAKAQGCVETLGAQLGTFSGELSISIGVKWNGRSTSISVTGTGVPKGVDSCVKGAIPRARYPQPPPGRDGKVRATLKIARE